MNSHHSHRRRALLLLLLAALGFPGLLLLDFDLKLKRPGGGSWSLPNSDAPPTISATTAIRSRSSPGSLRSSAKSTALTRGVASPVSGKPISSTSSPVLRLTTAGLCATDPAIRRGFASDLLNLTLATPGLNRHGKRDHDAADWLPPINRCWFAGRIVEVRRTYGLTIDRREADVLGRVLSSCSSTHLVIHLCGGERPE